MSYDTTTIADSEAAIASCNAATDATRDLASSKLSAPMRAVAGIAAREGRRYIGFGSLAHCDGYDYISEGHVLLAAFVGKRAENTGPCAQGFNVIGGIEVAMRGTVEISADTLRVEAPDPCSLGVMSDGTCVPYVLRTSFAADALKNHAMCAPSKWTKKRAAEMWQTTRARLESKLAAHEVALAANPAPTPITYLDPPRTVNLIVTLAPKLVALVLRHVGKRARMFVRDSRSPVLFVSACGQKRAILMPVNA